MYLFIFSVGKPLAQDNRMEVMVEPPRLTIKRLTKEDRGMYQCIVSNNWDQAQATAELDMGDAGPELVYWFSEQTLQPGPTVSLKCVATGNPPPQFTWTLDGFPIPDHSRFLVGENHTLFIWHLHAKKLKFWDILRGKIDSRGNLFGITRGTEISILT